jgi:hypothetical protein
MRRLRGWGGSNKRALRWGGCVYSCWVVKRMQGWDGVELQEGLNLMGSPIPVRILASFDLIPSLSCVNICRLLWNLLSTFAIRESAAIFEVLVHGGAWFTLRSPLTYSSIQSLNHTHPFEDSFNINRVTVRVKFAGDI